MTLYQVLHELQIVLALILGACPLCSQPITIDRLAAALTPTWQLPILPRVPEYCRATHGDALPSFGNPVSSTTSASTGWLDANHRATFTRTAA